MFLSKVLFIPGTSESSVVVEARTKGRSPEAPPQFQFLTSNSTQATLYLSQWGDGGCPITHFMVYYRKGNTEKKWVTGEAPSENI